MGNEGVYKTEMEDFFAVIWAFFIFTGLSKFIGFGGEKDFICPGRSFSVDFFTLLYDTA